MSELTHGQRVRETALGIRVEKTLANLADGNIFTTYGRVLITLLFGQVTVSPDAGATTIKLQEETNTQDLCAATTITADAIGTMYFLTGEMAVILNGTLNTPIIDIGANLTGMPSAPVIFGREATANAIQLVQTGDDADGYIKWVVLYIPLDEGAYIEAA
ncbi:MAG: hypothetical protein E3J29_06645 [Dehalococcoidia bacterium]|nr:MAG: hypothetical protein E3J29_06645 [Dehalococcoidia bacterium]